MMKGTVDSKSLSKKSRIRHMNYLIKLFNHCAMVAPFLLSVLLAIICILDGWKFLSPTHDAAFYMRPELKKTGIIMIIWLLSIAVAVFIINKLESKKYRFREVVELTLVMLIALGLRMALIGSQGNYLKPFSDFGRVWQMAHGEMEGNIEYYTLFPAYLNYTVALRLFLRLTDDSFKAALIPNVILSAGTTALIYLVAAECSKDRRIPLIASLLYAVMPSNILYCCVLTPEFITIFFNCFAILVLVHMRKSRDWKKLVLAACAGVFLGISSSYKAFGIVIIISFTMCSIAEMIVQETRLDAKRMGCIILGICILYSGYKLTKDIILRNTEEELSIKLDEGTALPHFLLIGLNTEGEGQIHLGTISRRYYQYYLENGQDSESAKAYAFGLLKKDWAQNAGRLPALFFKKLIWTWQDDIIPVDYYNSAKGSDFLAPLDISGMPVASIAQGFYLLLMGLGLVGMICISRQEIDLNMELILLTIFGFFCLMLIVEAQSRYKCLIMPLVCIIAAFGLDGKHLFQSNQKENE